MRYINRLFTYLLTYLLTINWLEGTTGNESTHKIIVIDDEKVIMFT